MDSGGPPGSRNPVERRPSRSLLRDGSLTAGLGGLALRSMSLGSQDLAGMLDSSLQHMQTLSKHDLELLSSPKWKVLLAWDDEEGSPVHLDTSGSTATRVPPHCAFDADAEGSLSPGVSQRMGGAGQQAAWQGGDGTQQPGHHRPRGFGGKKRPYCPEGEEGPSAPVRRRLVSITPGDAMQLDAEAAEAEAAAAAAAFDAAAAEECGRPAELSPAALAAAGLSRIQLEGCSGPYDPRRLTAAAAAAAVSPEGRRGPRVQRGDSNVPLLMARLPGDTPAELLPATQEQDMPAAGPCGLPSPAAVQPKPEPQSTPALAAAGGASRAVRTEEPSFVAPPARPGPPPARQQLPSKSHKAVATGESGVFTSPYRGVVRHRLTGRWEAHFWDSSYVRPNAKKGGRSRGRQVYLGGYETEVEAARAYDRCVVAHSGLDAPLNFPREDYVEDLVWMQGRTLEEVVSILRRGSVGFAKGQSQYRGVTRHRHSGKWDARIGRVQGNKYLYLGTYDSAEDAARAYDRACVKYRGHKAILNFDLSHYQDILDDPDSYEPVPEGASPDASPAGAPCARERSVGSGPQAGDGLTSMQWDPALLQGFGQGAAMAPGAATAASAAALANAAGGLFLPLVHPMATLPLGMQQQLGLQFGLPAPAAAPTPPASGRQAAASSLPSIRTRLAPASQAAALAGQGAAGTPASAASLPPELHEFLLSPLASSLLSPLGRNGTPLGWRDSPLGRMATGELSRLLSGLSPAALASPGSAGGHRLRHTSSFTPVGPSAGFGGIGRRPSDSLSSQGSELDLLSALQWLDSLEPSHLAALAAIEEHSAPPGAKPVPAGRSEPGASGSGRADDPAAAGRL